MILILKQKIDYALIGTMLLTEIVTTVVGLSLINLQKKALQIQQARDTEITDKT